MSGRREFLAGVGAALGALGLRTPRTAAARITVDAAATIFRKAPDGRLTLVRFTVRGSDAIAGRLRVYDAARQLIGTAGVLRRGDVLAGELWLPIGRHTRVRTELETPETRHPLRTAHVLDPGPRWIVHWMPVAPIDDHATALLDAATLVRGAVGGALAAEGLRLAPVPPTVERAWGRLDHLDLVRVVAPAAEFAAQANIPLADAAVLDGAPAHPGLALALAGSGVRTVFATDAPPTSALTGPDGSIVSVVAVGRGATPANLGLQQTLADAERQIASWLATFTPPPDPSATEHALIVGAAVERFGVSRKLFDDWNATYAYPKLVLGEVDAYREAARSDDHPMPPSLTTPPAAMPASLDAAAAASIASARREQNAARSPRIFRPLAQAIGAPAGALDAMARAFSLPIAGIAVLNPTPFARSDVVEMADGGIQVVTDVPGNGYAVVPAAPVHATAPVPGGALAITGAVGRVEIDRSTGAVAAIDAGARGWIDPGLRVNDVIGARLESWTTQVIPGIGTRIDLTRSTPDGSLRSRVTVYDTLPFLDLENAMYDAPSLAVSHACFARPSAYRWEVPGGAVADRPPASPTPLLRWIAVGADAAGVTMAADGAGAFSVDAAGRVTLIGTSPLRCRLTLHATMLADDPWRTGWSIVPLEAFPTGRFGPSGPPSFGSLFATDQAGVVVLDAIAVEGDVIAYVQEIAGVARRCRVLPRVLAFAGATHVDLAGRSVGPADVEADGGVALTLRPFGISALRLEGVRLNQR